MLRDKQAVAQALAGASGGRSRLEEIGDEYKQMAWPINMTSAFPMQ